MAGAAASVAWPLRIAAGVITPLLLVALWQGWMHWRQQPDERRTYSVTPQGELVLQVFKPRGVPAHAKVPALLFFHGGTWQGGDPSQFYPQCRYWRDRGLFCASVGYRLGQVHGTRPSDAVQDARDALRHLRRHADALGIDATRIAAAGGSAGGHLAAALGTALPLSDARAEAPESARADALLLLNPMLDFAPGMPDHRWVADVWAQISPARHVDARTPPTLILSGSDDPEVAVATVQAFCSAVQAQGVRCEAVIYPGAQHGFFNADRGDGHHFRQTMAEIERFLSDLGWWSATRG